MTADEAPRSAKETLSKIADELQVRRSELAHRLGLDGVTAGAKVDGSAAGEGSPAQVSAEPKPSVETLIQAAVEALGPRYESTSRTLASPHKQPSETTAAPGADGKARAETSQPVTEPPASDKAAPWFAPARTAKTSAELQVSPAAELAQSRVEPTPVASEAPSAALAEPRAGLAPPPARTGEAVAFKAAEAPAPPALVWTESGEDVLAVTAAMPAEAEPPTVIPAMAAPAAPIIASPAPAQAAALAAPAALTSPGRKSSLTARMTHAVVHSLDDRQTRAVAATYFPMLIAVVALAAAIYQAYAFHAGLDVVQRSVARSDYARACRDLVESYYAVKQKVGVLMPGADRSNVAGASRVTEYNRIDAQAAVARFGTLGTYLAAAQDPGTRARYTELMRTLAGTLDTARTTQLADIDKLFEPADKLFAVMNDDCARLSRPVRM